MNRQVQQRHKQQQQQQQHGSFAAPRRTNHALLAALLRSPPEQRPFTGAFDQFDQFDQFDHLHPAASAGGAAPGGGGGGGGDSNASTVHGHPPRAAGLVGRDPAAYARNNLRLGLHTDTASEDAALAQHYSQVLAAGSSQPHKPVLCAKVPVYISYIAPGGLCNVIYTNLAMWAVAAELGADVVLPHANKRLTYQHSIVDMLPQVAHEYYKHVPYSSLFNLHGTMHMLSELGVRAATHVPPPSRLLQSRSRSVMPSIVEVAVNINKPHKHGWHLPDLLRNLTQTVIWAAAREQAARAGRGEATSCDEPPVVHMRLEGEIRFALRLPRLPMVAHLSKGLRLADVVLQRATLFRSLLAGRGYSRYNGLHLRLEGDHTSQNKKRFGSEAKMVKAIACACQSLGWGAAAATNGTTCPNLNVASSAHPPHSHQQQVQQSQQQLPVYIASGLFSYPEGRQRFASLLEARELAPCLAATGTFLHRQALAEQLVVAAGSHAHPLPPLDSEQAAAVDLLMLLHARQFVGSTGTTFSLYTAQQRVLLGQPPQSNALAGHHPPKGVVLWESMEIVSLTTDCIVLDCAER